MSFNGRQYIQANLQNSQKNGLNSDSDISDGIKEFQRFLIRDEIITRSDQRSLFTHIKNLVSLAKVARQDDLNEKRNRLRALLQKEDFEYEQEFIQKIKARQDSYVQQKQTSLLALRKETEKQSEQFAKQKKLQQYINNCDEIRTVLRKNILTESKISQLAQIEEKKAIEKEKNATEQLWNRVQASILEAQLKREKDLEEERRFRNQKDQIELRRQMATIEEIKSREKQELREERLRLEAELKAEAEKESATKELALQKKLKLAETIKAELSEGVRLRKIREENEIHYEHLFTEAVNRQIKKEKKEIQSKVNRVKEATLRYLAYCNEVKKQRKTEEKLNDQLLQQYCKEIEDRKTRKWQEEYAKKAEDAKEAHVELLDQIRTNREKHLAEAEMEYKMALSDRDRYRKEERLEKESEWKKILSSRIYGKELMQQIDQIKQYQKEQKEQFEEDLRKAIDEEDFRRCLAEKFIQEDIDYLPPHPNWKFLSCSCIQQK